MIIGSKRAVDAGIIGSKSLLTKIEEMKTPKLSIVDI